MTQNRSDSPPFPWRSVLVLAGATLLMVTAEMLPAAVLAPMSAGLGAAEAEIGALVSIWAGTVVVASFPLSRLARRWRARPVVITALLVLAASSIATALSPTFTVAVIARLAGAAAVGLLWATVNAFVADLVPDRVLGRAVAIVLGGGTLGMVIGTPLGRLLADASDWRAAFAGLGGMLLLAALAVRIAVPSVTRERATGMSSNGASAGVRLACVTALVALALVGHYGAYTFLTRLAGPAATILPGGMSAALFVFGLSSAVGILVAARVVRTSAGLIVTIIVTAVAVAGASAASHPTLSVLVIALWGLGSGAFPPLAQTLILRIAGPGRRDFAGALIPVLFNGGIALGAGAASLLVAGAGVSAVPVPAAVVVLTAALLLVVSERRSDRVPQGWNRQEVPD